jgi:hypothetical protein
MPLSHYSCMQPACSLHVDRLPVVDAVQPSANALQAIDIRGLPIDMLLINIVSAV